MATEQQPVIQSTMSAAPTKQLTSTDILSKMQAGQPLYQGEKLPDVPKGMSAKGFYGQFPGGASVYSQAPFKQARYTLPKPVQQPEQQPETQPETPATQPVTPTDEQVNNLQLDLGSDDIPDNLLDNIRINNPNIDIDLTTLEDLTDPAEYAKALEEFNNKLIQAGTDVVNDLGKSINDGITTAKNQMRDFEEFITDNPLGKTGQAIAEEWNEFTGNLEKLTSPNTYTEALSYFGEKFAKTALSQVFGMSLRGVLGGFAGPVGIALTELIWGTDFAATQIGVQGVSFGFGDPWEGSHEGTGKSSTVAGYNSFGMAVNPYGEPVYGYDSITNNYTQVLWDGISRLGSTPPTPEEVKKSGEDFVQTNPNSYLNRGVVPEALVDYTMRDDDDDDGSPKGLEDDPYGMKGAEATLGTQKEDIDQYLLDMQKETEGINWGGKTDIHDSELADVTDDTPTTTVDTHDVGLSDVTDDTSTTTVDTHDVELATIENIDINSPKGPQQVMAEVLAGSGTEMHPEVALSLGLISTVGDDPSTIDIDPESIDPDISTGSFKGVGFSNKSLDTSQKMADFLGGTAKGEIDNIPNVSIAQLSIMATNPEFAAPNMTYANGVSLNSLAIQELANRLNVPVEDVKALLGPPTMPEAQNYGGDDEGGYDAGTDFSPDTTVAEHEAALAEQDTWSGGDDSGGGPGDDASDDAGPGGEDTGGEGPGGGW